MFGNTLEFGRRFAVLTRPHDRYERETCEGMLEELLIVERVFPSTKCCIPPDRHKEYYLEAVPQKAERSEVQRFDKADHQPPPPEPTKKEERPCNILL